MFRNTESPLQVYVLVRNRPENWAHAHICFKKDWVRPFGNIWHFWHMLLLFLGASTYSFLPRIFLQPVLIENLGRMDRVGCIFISFTLSEKAALLPWRETHPSGCHVNHRPTGSRLFTLVSLPPKFDYYNCLLTMCFASFHTSSSCEGQRWWAVCVVVKVEASSTEAEPLLSLSTMTPKPSTSEPTLKLLLMPYCVFSVTMCPWPRRSL